MKRLFFACVGVGLLILPLAAWAAPVDQDGREGAMQRAVLERDSDLVKAELSSLGIDLGTGSSALDGMTSQELADMRQHPESLDPGAWSLQPPPPRRPPLPPAPPRPVGPPGPPPGRPGPPPPGYYYGPPGPYWDWGWGWPYYVAGGVFCICVGVTIIIVAA